MPKVSVIIPVHNGAKKLPRTAEQILNQTYHDLELILVENGSADNSWQLCQSLAHVDSRVRAIQSEPATILARKAGVLAARGEYITFSDCDDRYINNQAISSMVQKAEETNADIVQFGNYAYKLGKMTKRVPKVEQVIERKELLETYIDGVMGAYEPTMIGATVWSKIYKSAPLKSACSKIDKPLIKSEDLCLNAYAFFEESVRKVASTKECYYVYYTGIGGSGSENAAEELFEEYRVYKPIALQLAKEHGAGAYPIIKCHRETLNFMNGLITQSILRGDKREQTIKTIGEYASWDFVREASDYFRNDANPWDEHILRLSAIDDPDAYYERCLAELGNLQVKRIHYNVKRTAKNIFRWIDKL